MMARNNRPDTKQDIEDRLLRRWAGEQACKDREDRYPTLDADNAREALDYQTRREQELLERSRAMSFEEWERFAGRG